MKYASGKFVIITILSVALAAAGAAWWFRYAATNRAVDFWGSNSAQAIRDAPIVELFQFEPSDEAKESELDQWREIGQFLDASKNRHDISSARGLTHFRAALLEDRSYLWPARPQKPSDEWRWIVLFRDETSGRRAVLLFSPNWQLVTNYEQPDRKVGGPVSTAHAVTTQMVVSCEPIESGLKKMLGELAESSVSSVER